MPEDFDRAGLPEDFSLSVNGHPYSVRCDRETPLLYVLRNDLGLMGSRFGCGLGLCGACNVLLEDRVVHSCDTPIWMIGTAEVTTVEALGTPEDPGALQRSFIDAQAAQCGFCISGILVSATALLRRQPDADESQIRSALDGNLCRCGSHNRIVRAVLAARPAATSPAATSPADGVPR
jgi:nicotinate dehydrogenase subunit A